MNAAWILNWWNLIFVLPFGLALLYLGLYTVSGITFGDSDLDADGDLDIDHDVDMDHDVDADADADQDIDADHDLDADHDADAEHELEGESQSISQGSSAGSALSWLGVGRVPLSIVLMVLLLTWGVVGFITNAALQRSGAAATIISVPVAAVVSLAVTRLVAMFIARYLPLYETTARRRHELLGSIGEAILPIDRKFGMASVRDQTGDLYQVACRAEEDADPIPKGTRVQLISYNAKQGLFYVTRQTQTTTAA